MLQREFKGKVVHGYMCTNLEGRGGGGGGGRRNYCAERCIVLFCIAKSITCEI